MLEQMIYFVKVGIASTMKVLVELNYKVEQTSKPGTDTICQYVVFFT